MATSAISPGFRRAFYRSLEELLYFYTRVSSDPKYEKIRIKNWRIVNVLGTCNLPFGIKIVPFSQAFKVNNLPFMNTIVPVS